MSPSSPVAGLTIGPRADEAGGRRSGSDAAWTFVGPLDSSAPARVDGAGLITPHGTGWSIDWWIGADDRWYFPSREATVRQARLGPGPVLRTSVRIPSGDAHQRVHAAVVAGREVVVIEVENDSPVPVALALAIRPYTVDGSESDGPPQTIRLASSVVTVDGRPALRLPRAPNESGASATADLADVVTAGDQPTWEQQATNAVVLYPLPHRTTLRFVVPAPAPIGESSAPVPDPGSVPDHEAVARGWRSVLDNAARFELPDNGLGELLEAARARLLLDRAPTRIDAVARMAPGAGAVLQALAFTGHRSEVRPLVDAVAEGFPRRLDHGAADAAAVVAALGPAHHLLAAGAAVPPSPELLEAAAQITHLVEKAERKRGRSWGRGPVTEPMAVARAGLAALATAAGDLDAARHLVRGPTGSDPRDLEPDLSLASVTEAAERASDARSWGADSASAAARFINAVRHLLIDEGVVRSVVDRGEGRSAELHLLPTFPSAWRGGNLEVHRAPTAYGELSFGIRWHGFRPALLWQLDPVDTVDGAPVVLRCPGLDPSWSTVELRGEALLAGSADDPLPIPGPGDGFR